MTLKIAAFLGAKPVEQFSIDLSTHLDYVGPLEWRAPEPIVALPGMAPPPMFALYPLPDQVADKVCAMYETHGSSTPMPSTRYRDLVDLLLIICHFPLDAALLRKAFSVEATRRRLRLPTEIRSPAPSWEIGFPKTAAESPLASNLHSLASALDVLGQCLDPILNNEVTNDQIWSQAKAPGESRRQSDAKTAGTPRMRLAHAGSPRGF
jgi:hypothetical protein